MSETKNCLVTGASSGIGYAIAEHLLSEGHSVTVTARRKDRLVTLEGATILSGDLTLSDIQNRLIDSVTGNGATCDYLFNCAGCIEVGTIEQFDIDRMAAMLRLNIEATFRLTYLFLKKCRQQGYGHVVNISSVMGTKVRPTAGPYSASKFALEALSEALRMELAGTNIQVSCIEPGLVLTELHNRWEVHPKESMNIKEPLLTSDIVEAVKFIMKQPSHVRIPRMMLLPGDHVI
jgi:NADP-dependent 3-hydroxy acid dehydrogenase YdfG